MAPTTYQALGTYYVSDNQYGPTYVVCNASINMAKSLLSWYYCLLLVTPGARKLGHVPGTILRSVLTKKNMSK